MQPNMNTNMDETSNEEMTVDSMKITDEQDFCENCGRIVTIINFECSECHTVLKSDHIDTSREYVNYQNGDYLGMGKKVLYGETGVIGSTLRHSGRSRSGIFSSRGNNYSSGHVLKQVHSKEYRQHSGRRNGIKLIVKHCNNLNLGKNLIQSMKGKLDILCRDQYTKKKYTEHIAAVVVFLVARENRIPVTYDEISSVSGIEVHKFQSVLRKVCNQKQWAIPRLHAGKLLIEKIIAKIPDYNSTYPKDFVSVRPIVSLSEELVSLAGKEFISDGRKPSAICAAAIYISSKKLNFKISFFELSEAAAVGITTIKDRYSEFIKVLQNIALVLPENSRKKINYDWNKGSNDSEDENLRIINIVLENISYWRELYLKKKTKLIQNQKLQKIKLEKMKKLKHKRNNNTIQMLIDSGSMQKLFTRKQNSINSSLSSIKNENSLNTKNNNSENNKIIDVIAISDEEEEEKENRLNRLKTKKKKKNYDSEGSPNSPETENDENFNSNNQEIIDLEAEGSDDDEEEEENDDDDDDDEENGLNSEEENSDNSEIIEVLDSDDEEEEETEEKKNKDDDIIEIKVIGNKRKRSFEINNENPYKRRKFKSLKKPSKFKDKELKKWRQQKLTRARRRIFTRLVPNVKLSNFETEIELDDEDRKLETLLFNVSSLKLTPKQMKQDDLELFCPNMENMDLQNYKKAIYNNYIQTGFIPIFRKKKTISEFSEELTDDDCPDDELFRDHIFSDEELRIRKLKDDLITSHFHNEGPPINNVVRNLIQKKKNSIPQSLPSSFFHNH